MSDKNAFAKALYKKLVCLYPQAFKERFRSSMEQTFDDLYDERTRDTGQVFSGFLVWLFAETLVAVAAQHLLLIRRVWTMRNIGTHLALCSIIGLFLVIPFVILEFVNTQGFHSFGFPAMLFAVMWVLAAVFVSMLVPAVRLISSGTGSPTETKFVFRAVLMIVVATVWLGLVNDQMPCFMGIPNCD